jgi:polysaccharide biosynthesis protein PslG
MTATSRVRRAGLVGLLAAALALIGCVPASAVNDHVSHKLFGVHDASLLASGHIHQGAVRLWDVGVQWRSVETARHHYDWTRLDQLVSAARSRHQEVTMVVAGTPSFYASDFTKPPRKMSHYADFLRHLMKRYGRRISAYEVWNESNIRTFWSGTNHQMARLSQIAYQVRNRLAPHAKLVSPAMVTGRDWELDIMRQFFRTRIGGKPVARFYNAIALSLYPFARANGSTGTPEDSMKRLAKARRVLRADHVPARKPIWNTEINYGNQTGDLQSHHAFKISAARQSAFVVRTYLLNAAAGIKRVFWYRYDMNNSAIGGGTFSNTLLSTPGDPSHVTRAGKTYALVQSWMHGTLLGSRHHRPCGQDRHGTYRCVVKDHTGVRRIYWNPSGKATVRVSKSAHHVQTVFGVVSGIKPGSRLTVSPIPVMVYH